MHVNINITINVILNQESLSTVISLLFVAKNNTEGRRTRDLALNVFSELTDFHTLNLAGR